MKADPAALLALWDVQGIDSAIERIKHTASTLPIHRSISAMVKDRTVVADDLVSAQTRLSDATAAAKRAEADVVPVRERLVRNQARVDAGQIEAKALSSALDEIEHLKQRISDLEDAQLEAMEELDQANNQASELAAHAVEIEASLREQVAARDHGVAELSSQARELGGQRAGKAATLPADLLGLYEKIRARSGGIGVAKLEGRRCSGCGLEATITDYNRYIEAAPNDVIRCAECDRILIR